MPSTLERGAAPYLHSSTEKDQRYADFPSPREWQIPDHWKRQNHDEKIGSDIHCAVDNICNLEMKTVARNFRIPEPGWWQTTKELGPEIAEQITENKKHRQPREVFEYSIHSE